MWQRKCCNCNNEITKSFLDSIPADSLLQLATENQNDDKAVAACYNEKLDTRDSLTVDHNI